MIARIQVRRDSSGNWTLNDPILTLGEIGYETDTEKFKVGDGSSNWSNLNYELGQWKSDSSGNITYGAQAGEGDVFIQNSLVVTGDLTVNGQTTTINTEEVTIEDNMVLLNSNLVIAPPSTLESGIEVNLGTSGSTKLYWDQATLKWTVEGDLNVEGDIYSNNIALWRLNGNDIYFDGGNVGIGTSSPDVPLHIYKNHTSGTGEWLNIGFDDINPKKIEMGSASYNAYMSLYSASAVENVKLNSSGNSYFLGGNVGIGTSSPSHRLHVVDPTAVYPQTLASFGNSDENSPFRIVSSSNTEWGLQSYNSRDIIFENRVGSGTPSRLMTIKNDGNVGIGTSSPSAKLEVESPSGAGNTNLFRLIRDGGYGDTTFNQWYTDGAGTPSGSNPTALYGLNMGLVVGSANNGKVAVRLESQGGSNTIDDSIVFRTANSDKVFIKSSGNVGIGTSSPSVILHLKDITPTSDNVCLRMENDAQVWDLCNRGFDNDKFTIYDVTSDSVPFKIEKSSPTNSVYIKSDGNVGIGTSSPNQDLFGSAKVLHLTSDSVTTLRLESSHSNGTDFEIAASNSQRDVYMYNKQSGDVIFGTSNTEKMRIDSSGNVGIGTSSPTAKLEVGIGASNTDGLLVSSANNALVTGDHIKAVSGRGSTDAYNLLNLENSTGTQMIVKGDGNVGIGTSSPSGKLDVNTGVMSGDVKIGNFDNVANGNNTAQFGHGTKLEFIADTNPKYSQHDPYTVAFIKAEYSGSGADTTSGDTDLVFATYDGFAGTSNGVLSEKMRITADGKVGIGTSSPSSPLHVKATDNIIMSLQSSDATVGNLYFNFRNDDGDEKGWIGYGSSTTDDFGIFNNEARNLSLGTSGTSRLVIDSSGKVGIGTSSPSSPLHVVGTNSGADLVALNLTNKSTADGTATAIRFTNSSITENFLSGEIAVIRQSDGSNDLRLNLKNSDATPTYPRMLTIDGSTGNVGIGTSSPDARLHTYGDNNTDITSNRIQNNGGVDVSLIAYQNSHAEIRVGTNHPLLFKTNGNNERMRISSSGNVGIGTSSPSEKLEVSGAIKLGTTSSTNAGTIRWSGSDFEGYTGSAWESLTSSGIVGSQWETSGSNIYYNSGNVGIGTSSPNGNLDVGGQIPSALASAANTIGVSGGTQGRFYVAGSNQAGMIQEDTGATANNKVTQLVTYGDTFRIVNLTDIYGTKSTSILVDKSTGFVGINKTSASEALDVSGNITATGTISSSSDITLKENIETISDPIEKVKEISGYTFNKKGEDLRLVGLIAQEVEKVLPEAVVENNEGLKSVAYGNMVALLIECVKKQDERIDQLEKTIEKMK